MGKLARVRAAARLREAGAMTVTLEVSALPVDLAPESWYKQLLDCLGEQLEIQEGLETFWQEEKRFSPLQRWMGALQEVVLPRLGVGRQASGVGTADPNAPRSMPNATNLVIFIEGIDAVRELPFSTDEFFAGIRECYNRRTEDREFCRLTFCLIGTSRPTELIRDARTTPFNIGRRFEIPDLSEVEGSAPAQSGRRWRNGVAVLLKRALDWIGGEPYLFLWNSRRWAVGAGGTDKSAASNANCRRRCSAAPGAAELEYLRWRRSPRAPLYAL
jgi:hypothetical protein